MKNFVGNLALACGSIVFTLVLAEVVFSFLPVVGIARTQPLRADGSGLDVSSVRNGSVTYSDGWLFKNPLSKKTNNYGFFSLYDYEPGASIIVSIGDSYTEAAQVEFPESYHQIAAKAVGKTIYNVAISGSPLSQYEAYLADSCKEFRPTAATFAIIHNDFDESFYEHRARNGFFHYSDKVPVTLTATPYEISLLRQLVSKSSLVRYLFFNLNLRHYVRQMTSGSASDHTVNISFSGASNTNMASKKRAIDLFLSRITNYCLPKQKIVLLLDADREAVYEGIARRDTAMIYMRARARALGFSVLDLQDTFAKHYASNGTRFETKNDPHWNRLGQSIVGKALANELKKPIYHRSVAQTLN